jgi:hypothetical protein
VQQWLITILQIERAVRPVNWETPPSRLGTWMELLQHISTKKPIPTIELIFPTQSVAQRER